jgi:hypothetical protein
MVCVSKIQALLMRPLGIVLRGRFLFVSISKNLTIGPYSSEKNSGEGFIR